MYNDMYLFESYIYNWMRWMPHSVMKLNTLFHTSYKTVKAEDLIKKIAK
jgi:hypothetical protein